MSQASRWRLMQSISCLHILIELHRVGFLIIFKIAKL